MRSPVLVYDRPASSPYLPAEFDAQRSEKSLNLDPLVESELVTAVRMAPLLDETRQLIAIFTTIDKRAKESR